MKRYRKVNAWLARRLLSLFVVVGVCAMLMPLPFGPLRSDSQEKDQSQPFPCQNRPCGCRSAEQCWKKCCCFNNSQKIAWAKAHKVAVPDYVLTAAEKEKRTVVEVCSLPAENTLADAVMKSKRGCSHCENQSVAEGIRASAETCSRIDIEKSGESRHCERKSNKSPGVASKPAASGIVDTRGRSSKWVMTVYSAECQGQGPHAYCSIVLVIPNSQTLKPAMPQMIETFSIESERLLPASLRPPVPPPKIGELTVAAGPEFAALLS